jgi:DNA-binding NtrC family response regulator
MTPSPDVLRDAHVLIVDDEREIRRALRRLLESAGVAASNLEEAESGEEALGLLCIERFDAVVCDYRMKAVSGIDVLAWVWHNRRPTGRILLTGYADLEMAVDAINTGKVHGFLQKPWDNAELLGKVRAVIREQHALPPPPQAPPLHGPAPPKPSAPARIPPMVREPPRY